MSVTFFSNLDGYYQGDIVEDPAMTGVSLISFLSDPQRHTDFWTFLERCCCTTYSITSLAKWRCTVRVRIKYMWALLEQHQQYDYIIFICCSAVNNSLFIVQMMREMENLTAVNQVQCITFRPKVSTDTAFITILNGSGCSAPVIDDCIED